MPAASLVGRAPEPQWIEAPDPLPDGARSGGTRWLGRYESGRVAGGSARRASAWPERGRSPSRLERKAPPAPEVARPLGAEPVEPVTRWNRGGRREQRIRRPEGVRPGARLRRPPARG